MSAFATRTAESAIIHGDNLPALRALGERYAGSVNLIYIDPPFSINRTFMMSDERASTMSPAGGSIAYSDTLTGAEYIDALEERAGAAYALLSENGSMYVHIDSKVAYDVKAVLDRVFGPDSFRNSISRIKSNPKNFPQRGYGSVKDTVLFYTVSGSHVWNAPRVDPGEGHAHRFAKVDGNGRYATVPVHAPGETRNGKTGGMWRGKMPPAGRHWRYSPERLDELDGQGMVEWSKTGNPRIKIYADDVRRKGVLLQDVWNFKDPQYPTYPTEKNLAMLEAIVRTSSNEGDTVLDYYCGSGTTLLAAAMHNRAFIGIDRSEEAIAACKRRLEGYEYSLAAV